MDVINIGSLNLDWVYRVPHFVQPGETLEALGYDEYIGGKGLNQSIALARAGARVAHVGAVGANGAALRETLQSEEVNTDFVTTLPGPSGHAIIQISPEGENAIVLFPGSNHQLTVTQIQEALNAFPESKAVLFQNETNALADIMKLAKAAGKRVFYNPAPMLANVGGFPLDQVDVLFMNEIEAQKLSGTHDIEDQCAVIHDRWPHLCTVLTQGGEGVTVFQHGTHTHYPAVKVEKIVDTTAAGDTFIGYFVAEYLKTGEIATAVSLATRAASLCIQQRGAVPSIPRRAQCT